MTLMPPHIYSLIVQCPLHVQRNLYPPHLLQVLEHGRVGIHEAVDAVLHARLLGPVKRTGRDLRSDAFPEANVCQAVNGWEVACQYNGLR